MPSPGSDSAMSPPAPEPFDSPKQFNLRQGGQPPARNGFYIDMTVNLLVLAGTAIKFLARVTNGPEMVFVLSQVRRAMVAVVASVFLVLVSMPAGSAEWPLLKGGAGS